MFSSSLIMGDLMKDDNKTKKQLVHELTKLRLQNDALKKSITGSISAELAAEKARHYAESIVENLRESLLVLDADLKIISANRNFYRTFKVTPDKTIGSFIYDLENKQWDIPFGYFSSVQFFTGFFQKLRELLEIILPKKTTYDDYEVEYDFPNIGKRIMLLNARPIQRVSGKERIILLTIEDITERKRMEAEILALSITDQLTGLHNRRGFLSLAEQQLKLAVRNKSEMLLFFADLDGLKWINDTLGHEEGDNALIEVATVFKETFRTSDIIARLGGDEYAVLTVDITEANSEIFTARLQSLIDTRNNQKNQKYRLSISVGCSYYDPENPCSIEELMASADKLMYEQKQNKKGLLLPRDSLSSSSPYPSMHDESEDK